MRSIADATLAALYPSVDPYRDDPVAYGADRLGVHLWSQQAAVANAVIHNRRVAWKACHGPGKTKTAGVIVSHFLTTRPGSRVITTAPTWNQVEALLWRSIRTDIAAAHERGMLTEFPVPTNVKWDLGPDWFAAGYSTDQPERFQGHHAPELLLVVDEASGVDEAIFEAAEGFLTAEGARVLLLGNPTRVGGTFYKAFRPGSSWKAFTTSVFDTPNYTGEKVPDDVSRALPRKGWAEEKAQDWGEDSPAYQVRVLGEFAESSERNVIALGDVEKAMQRTIPTVEGDLPSIIAVDVARFGDDETVIAERYGDDVEILEVLQGKDTVQVAARVKHWAQRRHELMRVVIVDDAGVGGGVTDMLRADGIRVLAFNGASSPVRAKSDYPNRRCEAWFEAGEQVKVVSLPADDRLLGDLTAPEYSYNTKLHRVVEAKDQTKKRLGRSPDRGDAVVMVLSYPIDRVVREKVSRDTRAGRSAGVGSIAGDILTDGF